MKRFLTDMDLAILSHLGKFTFLTVRQLLAIGVSRSARSLAHQLRTLTTFPTSAKPVIGVLKYPPEVSLGRVEHLYFLTPRGVELLCEANSEIDVSRFHLPKRPQPIFRDYHHRKMTVDAHILISNFLKHHHPALDVDFWDTYFQKSGANRSKKSEPLHAKTRVALPDDRYLIPDVVFHLRKKESEQAGLLIALEVSRGKDSKRLIRQLYRHLEALKRCALGLKYQLMIGHKVLVVCEQNSLLQGIWKRLPAYARLVSFANFFLFATWDEFQNDPATCWQIFGETGRFNFLTGKKASDQRRAS